MTSIAVTTNCNLNAAAIKLAAHHQVPILFFNNYGTIQARLWSPYFVNLAALRKKQLLFSMSAFATDWAVHIFKKKTDEQITNLKQLARKKTSYKKEVADTEKKILETIGKANELKGAKIAEARQVLMGLEGTISRSYFAALKLFLPDGFKI